MRCARCGFEIERLRAGWWSQEISNSYLKGQIHSNGYYCDGNPLGNQYHIPFSFRDYINLLKNRVVHLDINRKQTIPYKV